MRQHFFKTLIPLLIVLLILPMSAFCKQKKGAKVIIYTSDGQRVKGELLRVKDGKLLIMREGAITGATFSMDEIDRIGIMRKNRFLKGVFKGLVVGAGSGCVLALVSPGNFDEASIYDNKLEQVLVGVVAGSILGIGIGAIHGLLFSKYKRFNVRSKSEKDQLILLEKLEKMARFH